MGVQLRAGGGVRCHEHARVFDVNALCVGGWIPFPEWANELVPWLLEQAEPKATGEWWPTHCLEVHR